MSIVHQNSTDINQLIDILLLVNDTCYIDEFFLVDNGFEFVVSPILTDRKKYAYTLLNTIIHIEVLDGFIINKLFFIIIDGKLVKHRDNDLPQQIEYTISGEIHHFNWFIYGDPIRIGKGIKFPISIYYSLRKGADFREHRYISLNHHSAKNLLTGDKIVLYCINYKSKQKDIIDEVYFVYKLRNYTLTELNQFRLLLGEQPTSDIEAIPDLFTAEHLSLLEMHDI